MRRVLLGSAVAVLALTDPARAGYRELMTAVDGYQPPPVVSAQLTAAGPVEPPPSVDSDEASFLAQRAELERHEAWWRDRGNGKQGEAPFLTPDPALTTKWQAAAGDDAAIAKALASGFSLKTLEALVLLRNPAIQVKTSEFEGALAGYSQAEHLDTILRRYASLTKSVMTGAGGMSNPDPVTLKFPFPGILALKGEIVDQEVRAARESLEATRRDAVTAVRKAYAELVYSREARELTRSQLDLLTDLQQALSTRYQAGDVGFEEVLQVGIELERIKEELTSFTEEQGNAETAIRSALSLPESVRIGVPAGWPETAPVAGLPTLNRLALAYRQEIRAKEAMVGKAERMVEMAETMIYPGFATGSSLYEPDAVSAVGRNQAMDGDQPAASASAGAGVPLPKTPWFGADDAYLDQARQEIRALTGEVESLRAETLVMVREGWYRLDKARRQKELYRDRITTLSRAGLDTVSEAYAAGKVPFTQLIEAADRWLAARLGLSRARADMLIALAELDAAVGVDSARWPALRDNASAGTRPQQED